MLGLKLIHASTMMTHDNIMNEIETLSQYWPFVFNMIRLIHHTVRQFPINKIMCNLRYPLVIVF